MPLIAYSFWNNYPSSRRAIFDNWQRVTIASNLPIFYFIAVRLRQNKRNLPAVYRYPLNFHWFILRHIITYLYLGLNRIFVSNAFSGKTVSVVNPFGKSKYSPPKSLSRLTSSPLSNNSLVVWSNVITSPG